MKTFIKTYCWFTRKERTGIFVLLLLIIISFLFPLLYSYMISSKKSNYASFQKEITQLTIAQYKDSTDKFSPQDFSNNNYYSPYPQSIEKNKYDGAFKGEPFYFDPNTLPVAGWRKLGIRDKTIQTIQNYLSKGGKFYHPADIGKIWGLHQQEAERLMPYVSISQQTAFSYKQTQNSSSPISREQKYHQVLVDINTADTSAFIALPGIGSKLANRIVTFRNKLGGFYSIAQVAETFGLPDSVFQRIKGRLTMSNDAVKQWSINTATLDELKIHPYIRYALANAIVQYRMQHGNFSSLEDLKKIMMVNDDLYKKLKPYLLL